MKKDRNIAVIFWGPHSIEAMEFARHLNAQCYLIHYLLWKRPFLAPIKYIPMWLKTWIILVKHRPSSVFVANTPVFAPLCIYLYCRAAGIPFAMIVHGHTLSGRKWGWSRPLQRFLGKRALVNMVSNSEYERIFKSWGANVLFLEAPPLSIPYEKRKLVLKPEQLNVTVISTFAGDEPLDLVLGSARLVPKICWYILGDKALADKKLLVSAPENIKFTGYLKGDQYWDQLYSSQVIMTLTTNPHSLVAGGTEGMYIGRPLVLSRQPTLVDYFTKGVVFVDHTVESIAEGVQRALAEEKTLSWEISDLAFEKRRRWDRTFQDLLALLGNSCD